MADTVTITIDNQAYDVLPGLNLVDVAKQYDIDIPVFCYHPKMDPVGMCRMCLVELGSVAVNRATGEPELDDNGDPVVRWFPKLQTACTQTTFQGMVVKTNTAKALEGRAAILEFLLTSHPLDCPICDKGGECPLQNLTMAYGPGESRFLYDDKLHLDKHVPLGDLIYLDRERCIQCARCVRFCDEIVGDDVLAFHERGRRLQIVTISDPAFDTKFSGDTTDICPVGALTTADFRFGARAWELKEVPSICAYCPVGCNISASTRLDRDSGGKHVIKRIMPRQNESVNEIWICDKGRFGHHHSLAADRLTSPMKRENGAWVEIDWATAYKEIGTKLAQYKDQVGFLAGPMLSNEDYWEMRRLARLTDRNCQLGLWPATMTGHEQVTQVGVGVGTRIQDMGSDSAILVIASDLEEEAPVWYLQVKQAADRGAKVVVANGRPTKLDQHASATVHYAYGDAVDVLNNFAVIASRKKSNLDSDLIDARVEDFAAFEESLKGARVPKEQNEAAEMLCGVENLVVFVGGEGLTLDQHAELMQAAANLLIMTGHVARPNNGLVPVWDGGNMQGAFDMGFSSEATVRLLDTAPALWFIAEADPVGEDGQMAATIEKAEYVVVSTQFMTPTAEAADLVLPVQSFAEREGTYTSGMRRVQRFYMAQTPLEATLPGWKVFASIGAGMKGGEKARISAGLVMRDITQHVLRYAEMGYPKLAEVEAQFPDVGGLDLYYGGTAYANTGGLGVQWATNAEKEKYQLTVRPVDVASETPDGLLLVPVQVLYDRGTLFERSRIMHPRVPTPYAAFSAQDAADLGLVDGAPIMLTVDDRAINVTVQVRDTVPVGTVLVPRHLNQSPLPPAPAVCTVTVAEMIEG
ncbi:MAG: NADH-quinone oxidoreductase subunit NuoG [Anaerolineae bacterium]|nr:NADH-quinone oxidoreductase subunit NuoG [Anaerolineae bacterium]